MALVKRNTAYSLNDIAYTKYGKKLKCTTSGTTSTEPLIITSSNTINDGTVVWEVSEDGQAIDKVLLYEGNIPTGTRTTNITLSDNISNYTFLLFSDNTVEPDIIAVDDFIDRGYVENYHYLGTDWMTNCDIEYVDDTHINCIMNERSTRGWDVGKLRVYGIKTTLYESQGGQGLVDWASNTSYSIGDIVIYNNDIYRCSTAHTSTSTFDSTKWIEISASKGGLSMWESDKEYKLDDIVVYLDKIYKCITAHTSSSTFDSTKWEEISANDTVKQVLWEGKSYTAGDVLNLTDVYTNYDCIICYFVYSETGWAKDSIVSSIIIDPSKDYIVDASFQEDTSSLIKHYSMSFNGSTATLDDVDNLSSTYYVGRIEGIKIGNAFKVNSATKVNLLPASITVTRDTQELTLLDDVTNYDIIYVNWHEHHSDGINRCFVLTITKEEYEFANSNTTHDSFTDAHQVTPNSVAYVRLLVFPKDGTFEVITSSNGSNISSVVIDSIIGVSFNCPNNYSTDEQLIGTWIDGSPLYQKTFTGTTGSGNSGAAIDCIALGIDKCVDISGYIQNTNGGFAPVNYNNNTVCTAASFGADKTIYFVVNGSIFSNCPYSITIKYTKV